MANRQLPDFLTAENELNGQEVAYIAQNGKTRKSTLQKIKEFIIGTVVMGTEKKYTCQTEPVSGETCPGFIKKKGGSTEVCPSGRKSSPAGYEKTSESGSSTSFYRFQTAKPPQKKTLPSETAG